MLVLTRPGISHEVGDTSSTIARMYHHMVSHAILMQKKWMVNFIIPKTTVDTCVVNTNSSQNSKKIKEHNKNKKRSKHNIYIYNPNKQLKIQNKSDKQKINNIQTTGKQRLNRRLRKK